MELNPLPTLQSQSTNSPSTFDFHIATPRLYISYPNPSNASHIALTIDRMNSPATRARNPDAPTYSDRDAACAWLTASVERIFEAGYGRFVVSLRDDENDSDVPFSERARDLTHIGFVSMQLARIPDIPGPLIPDLGFNILPAYQGKGFASEAARYLMLWFRESKGIEKFAGLTDEGNEAAKRLFGRLGFREWGIRWVKGIRGEDGEVGREVSVWTSGVEGNEGVLGGLGL